MIMKTFNSFNDLVAAQEQCDVFNSDTGATHEGSTPALFLQNLETGCHAFEKVITALNTETDPNQITALKNKAQYVWNKITKDRDKVHAELNRSIEANEKPMRTPALTALQNQIATTETRILKLKQQAGM